MEEMSVREKAFTTEGTEATEKNIQVICFLVCVLCVSVPRGEK